ncbi:MAG TPA: MSMEG_0569 family flavin-dependent oxidoreductase [Polyangiaceae bacterium]|nr:MSMEG_0569 family flavin-dependent oxidoreductase [Polyangiaceae bacterium]
MPEMHFRVRWPNGAVVDCYSPSYVIEDYFAVGNAYSVPDFVERARAALTIASERVAARYGFGCSSALDQLRAIEGTELALAPAERLGKVEVLEFRKHAPRDARATGHAPEHHTVIVVGGGQAGLSASYWLKQRGIDHVVLEGRRVAYSWRDERWDTFCLVTPNWQCQLPGHPYAGPDAQGFMVKDQIVAYVESYRSRYDLPVREGVTVRALTELSSANGARFQLETSAGTFSAERVIVATGCYHKAHIPAYAANAPAGVVNLHSSNYKNPESLPEGAVLVVGSGQSGCQIAEDLLLAGRQVHLAVGSAPRCARRYRGRDVVEWLHDLGYYDIPIDEHPNREQVRDKTNHYVTGRDGGRDIDLRRHALAGMKLYGPLNDIQHEVAHFAPELKRNLDAADAVYRSINRTIDAYLEKAGISAPVEADYRPPWEPEAELEQLDLAACGVRSIVWCAGFASDFSWVRAPVLDERGFPRHARGVTEVEGLYFLGLPWLYTWGSGRFSGVGRDAGYVVEHIAAAQRERHDVARTSASAAL